LASLAVGTGFFALWFWLLPSWLGFRVDTPGAARWRWMTAEPSILGFAVALRCIWDFGWTGRRTPAPMAPPRKLVVVGFYRYVRNPMYVGFFVGWAGLWVVFGRASLTAKDPKNAAQIAMVQMHLKHIVGMFSEGPSFCARHESTGSRHDEKAPLLDPLHERND
jgi:steroid 5-alpha reductase family enzyme